MNNPLPPPEMPASTQKPQSMSGLLTTIQDEIVMVERALAGYTSLTQILRQLQNGLADGERKKGLPILKYVGTSDGRNAVEVACDLGKLDPAYVPGVLTPMCVTHALELYEALKRIELATSGMVQQVEQALEGQAEPEASSGTQEPVYYHYEHELQEEEPGDEFPSPVQNQQPKRGGPVPPQE